MNQSNKNANKSFLDKFQGRTNKVGKSGLQSVLTPSKHDVSSLDEENDKINEHLKQVDLDELIPSNPNKYSRENKTKSRAYMSRPPLKNPQKHDYVPSTYTPQSNNNSKDETISNHPPSRSLSNSTENSRGKYIFGKYLKLDKQALGHMQFLQEIQQKSYFKKNMRNNNSLRIS